MLRPFVLAVPFALFVTAASAGERIVIEHRPSPTSPGQPVRVHVNISFFVPTAVNDSEASFKAQEHARRMLYESAGKECGLLLATLASDCRLEAINVNMNRGYGQQLQGLNATGSFTYAITLK